MTVVSETTQLQQNANFLQFKSLTILHCLAEVGIQEDQLRYFSLNLIFLPLRCEHSLEPVHFYRPRMDVLWELHMGIIL